MIIRLMLGAAFALAIPCSVSAKDVEVTIAGGKAPLHGSYRVLHVAACKRSVACSQTGPFPARID